MKEYVETIKKNNEQINSLIEEIINASSDEAFEIDENGKFQVNKKYKKIIELEIQKILKIYHAEFPNLLFDKDRQLEINVYEGKHVDARYQNDALEYSSGIKDEIEDKSKSKAFLFGVMPHELSHAFGFGTGIFEGLTENVSREVSEKYGLFKSEVSRQDQVKVIQKIEKIIGRDKLVEHSHIANGEKERISIISQLIDDKLEIKEKNLFENLCNSYNKTDEYTCYLDDYFFNQIKEGKITYEQAVQILKTDEKMQKLKEEKINSEDLLNKNLDEYIEKNPDKLFSLGQTDIKGQSQDFQDVISFQEKEIESLGKMLLREDMKKIAKEENVIEENESAQEELKELELEKTKENTQVIEEL